MRHLGSQASAPCTTAAMKCTTLLTGNWLFQRSNKPRSQPHGPSLIHTRHKTCQELTLGKKAGVTVCARTHSCYVGQTENVSVVSKIKFYYNKTTGLLESSRLRLQFCLQWSLKMHFICKVINLSHSAFMARTLKQRPKCSSKYMALRLPAPP